MFTLVRLLTIKALVSEQLPTMAAAWLVAELVYKFHSFSLECAAFLATWFVFDALLQAAKRAVGGRAAAPTPQQH